MIEADSEVNLSLQPSRREFLKLAGAAGAAGLTAAAFSGCGDESVPLTKGRGKDNTAPDEPMTVRTNPHSGDKVGLLGYGCMRWPMKGDVIDQERTNELIDYAIEHGVNYFDTAPRYMRGLSEEATGRALKRHPRDKFFIATKLSNQYNDPHELTFEGAKEMLETSMRRLQVDYIDYYLIHSVGLEKDGPKGLDERIIDNGFLEYLKELKKKGVVRNIGFSFHGSSEIFEYMLSLDIQWDCALIQMNYVDWKNATTYNSGDWKNAHGGEARDAEYLYTRLTEKGIPVLVMEALLGGRLATVPHAFIEELDALDPGRSVASWGFRYAASFPNVLSVLSGMGVMDHLKENVKTFSPLVPVNEPEKELLERIGNSIANSKTVPCTACQYCMPCPYGIDIPGTFTHYNQCVNNGTVEKTERSDTYNEAREAFLFGYDRKVEKLRQAQHCIGCRICMPPCPQRIDIPGQMQRIADYREKLLKGEVVDG